MTALVWDEISKRFYETGVNKGVLYPQAADGSYPLGVPWNGLISVSESPSGAEPTPLYADNIKYLTMYSREELGLSIEAYTYPEEFEQCDGSVETADGVSVGQQNRKAFGLVYKTILGNDVDGNDLGYKLHLVYGCKASPSERAYSTINESPEAITFSWEITTDPVELDGYEPAAQLVIDSTKADSDKLDELEDELFGAYLIDANLPLPSEVISMMTLP